MLERTTSLATVVALLAASVAASQAPKKPAEPAAAARPARPAELAPFDPAVARRITVEELKARIDAGTNVIFVDSRSAFTGPKIQGAIQLSGAAAADWSKDQAKDALIVAYCTCPSEHTSMRLVLELQKQGFTNAFALKGGLTAWMNAGMPTESVAAAPAATP